MRELLAWLNERGVMCRPFWVPMNQLPMFKEELYVTVRDCSAEIYESCISIPSSVGITEEQLEEVVGKIRQFYGA